MHVYTKGLGFKQYLSALLDLFNDIAMGMRIHMCIDMFIHMYVNICIDMCIDMCMDLSAASETADNSSRMKWYGWSVEPVYVCVDTSRHVWRHVYRAQAYP